MDNKKTTIILFRGRQGVGKSVVSSAFSKQENLLVLRKDDIYDASSTYVADLTVRSKIGYDSLFKILESNIDSGTSLLLDYPFQINEDVRHLRKWCEDRGLLLYTVLVTCSDRTIWRNRLSERAKNPTPNQIITDLDELERNYGGLDIMPLENEIVVDTVDSIEIILEKIQNQIYYSN